MVKSIRLLYRKVQGRAMQLQLGLAKDVRALRRHGHRRRVERWVRHRCCDLYPRLLSKT